MIHIHTYVYIIHIYLYTYIYINAKNCRKYVASVCSPLKNFQLWSSLKEQDSLVFFQVHQDNISVVALRKDNSSPKSQAHIQSTWRTLNFCTVLCTQAFKLAAAEPLPGHQDQDDFVFRGEEGRDSHLQQKPGAFILQKNL